MKKILVLPEVSDFKFQKDLFREGIYKKIILEVTHRPCETIWGLCRYQQKK